MSRDVRSGADIRISRRYLMPPKDSCISYWDGTTSMRSTVYHVRLILFPDGISVSLLGFPFEYFLLWWLLCLIYMSPFAAFGTVSYIIFL